MDYIGSKEKLTNWIFDIIVKNDVSKLTFFDACTGSGAVAKKAATLGFKTVIANDIFEFSSIIISGSIFTPVKKLNVCYDEISNLNVILGKSGFFYKNYSECSGRLYFSNENAQKIDAIREKINDILDKDVKNYLLYCLLEAMNRVSNTAGVQAAFLKKLKKRAANVLVLKQEKTLSFENIFSYSDDILSLLNDPVFKQKHKEDILYIDPPYNHRQYGPNYHLYETLIKNDNPVLSGITGIRNWKNENKSEFCSKQNMWKFTEKILTQTRANRIYLSYNTDGLLSKDDLTLKISNLGYKVNVFEKEYKRFKSDSSSVRKYNNSKLYELLFEISK